ncbi:MAG: PepSY-like domain-containing protein [Flavitalea sp.]
MKNKFPFILMILAFGLSVFTADAQIRKIPATVTDSFKEKYPNASGVEWRDKLSVFTAAFTDDGKQYEAKYNSKGQWLNTEAELSQDDLPANVKDGFEKSKYTEWTVEKVHKIVLPNDETQYRLLIGKGDLQKKNLLYNSDGKLLKDKITI